MTPRHSRVSILTRLRDAFPSPWVNRPGHCLDGYDGDLIDRDGDMDAVFAPVPQPPGPPAAYETDTDQAYYGITLTDNPMQPAARTYAPQAEPLEPLPPYGGWGITADLRELPLFRTTVRDVFVRQEMARGFRALDVPWYRAYAVLYRARTAEPVPDYSFAEPLRRAEQADKAATATGMLARIGRLDAGTAVAA